MRPNDKVCRYKKPARPSRLGPIVLSITQYTMRTQTGDSHGATAQLCEWIDRVQYSHIPPEVLDRAKYIILDGIACALVGAHLPWSETAADIIKDMESTGPCQVFGHEMVR